MRELLQQALSALLLEATSPALPATRAAITALSEALASEQFIGEHEFDEQGEIVETPAVPAVPIWDQLREIGEANAAAYQQLINSAPAPSDKMGKGRLILEAASGMHGDVAKQLTAIYTDLMNSLAAPAVQPLTFEQIFHVACQHATDTIKSQVEFARAIERAHGITGDSK